MPHHLGNLRTGATDRDRHQWGDRVPLLGAALGPETASWSRRGGYVGVEVAVGTLDAPVLVCSTGIGGPTTATIRSWPSSASGRQESVGTCGSIQGRM